MIKNFKLFINENIEKKNIIKILNFPNGRQSEKWSCGSSALQMVLQYYGIDVIERNLIKDLKTTEKKGTEISNIIKYLNDNNFKSESIENMTIDDLKKYINKKIPVIISIQAWKGDDKIKYENTWEHGHYTIVIGYTENEIILSDPSSNNLTYLTYNQLIKRWHDKDSSKKYINHGIIINGKEPKYDKDKIIPEK